VQTTSYAALHSAVAAKHDSPTERAAAHAAGTNHACNPRKWQRGLRHRMQDYTITVVLNERSAGMSFSAPPHEPAQIALVGIAGVVERQPQLQHSAVVSAMLYDA
jgi:hypothetical protein